MKIVIFCEAQKLRNGKENPKNYPWWVELISLLEQEEYEIIQAGSSSDKKYTDNFVILPLKELKELINKSDLFISVDSIGQHLGWSVGKKGIGLFGQSDPKIFGHEENINLYSDEKYFRQYQFHTWEECEYIKESFVSPEVILHEIKML